MCIFPKTNSMLGDRTGKCPPRTVEAWPPSTQSSFPQARWGRLRISRRFKCRRELGPVEHAPPGIFFCDQKSENEVMSERYWVESWRPPTPGKAVKNLS